MATIKRGILGGFSGKVGSIVGTSWKGIAVMKAMPLSVANPQTPSQVANRVRNSKVLEFAQAVGTPFIRTFWNRNAKNMSGFNMFMSVNAMAYDAQADAIQPSDVVLAQGSIKPVTGMVAAFNAGETLELSWDAYGNDPTQSVTDVLQVVYYNIDTKEVLISAELPASSLGVSPATPGTWLATHTVAYWVVSRRANSTDFSMSLAEQSVIQ